MHSPPTERTNQPQQIFYSEIKLSQDHGKVTKVQNPQNAKLTFRDETLSLVPKSFVNLY